jgi:spermidine/putrescine transport system ATP-binding protein/putrescine transport system ATP-binding protein
MPPSDPIISIRGVTKAWGAFRAVDDVSFDIRDGEFLSLLGASGSGKTTLLRMLAGFETATAGEILIGGASMDGVPPFRRPVNMVFQNYALFPHLDVADNIAYGLRRQRLDRARRAAMVAETLELMRLPGYGTRRVHELSGGQRQRVALARALILKPRVLLLDEPLAALDRQLREQMQIELRRLQRAVGVTFVLVTHDQEEALTLSDRVAVMERGRVLQIDTPDGIYEAPRCRRVAGFIGAMNFFPARALGRAAGAVQLEAAGLGPLEVAAGRAPEAGPVVVALRPEAFALSEARDAPEGPCAAGVVEAVAYLGDRLHVHVRVDGLDRPVAVSAPNTGRGAGSRPTEGRAVWLRWPPEAVMAFADD